MLDNFITIAFKNNISDNQAVKILHNSDVIYQGLIFEERSFEIERCREHNTLTIEGASIEDINDVRMFNLGSKKLIQLFDNTDNKLKLDYEFPVFPWLHQKLNFGWIVKSI